MGYYVQLDESTFRIPAENLNEAAVRLKALNHKPGVYKRGGSSDGREWFSWMEENYDELYDTAQEIFEAVGFDTHIDHEGGLILDYYDNKTGQEDLFVTEVADLADSGWYMLWRGEDGAHWKHTAEGVKTGTVVYD